LVPNITYKINPAEIESIEANSIAEEIGFESGDSIISINGKKPRDLIDYQILISEEILDISVLDKNHKIHNISIEKDQDSNLGINFKDALFDSIKQCNNKCPFCFIDQQPSGKRKSLYIKDDDYRLSFLYGSYLTLTNLKKEDWERIALQKLSPLFISVHATDPAIREKLLKNKKAGVILDQISWFEKNSIQIHAQIVVCPDINDGEILEKSILELAEFYKKTSQTVLSVAIVPVGLTKFRPENDGLKSISPEYAKKTGLEFTQCNSYGAHYSNTLKIWREKFFKSWEHISKQGFDNTFKRMWNFYLSYCEAGFRSKNIDLIQFSLLKNK